MSKNLTVRKSPLQLEHYWVLKVAIEASPSEPDTKSRTNYSTQVEVSIDNDDPNKFRSELTLKFKQVGDPTAPYSGIVTCAADFRVLATDEISSEKKEALVRVHGAALLHSVIRDLVFEITSRGPWGPFMIPTLTIGMRSADTEAKRKSEKKVNV